MRRFFRKTDICLEAILLCLLLAVSFFALGLRESGNTVPLPAIEVAEGLPESPLHTPFPERSGENSGLWQFAFPGGGVPSVTVSRRISEPLLLRFFRSGESSLPSQELLLVLPRFHREKYRNHHIFIFQSFLKHSLPVRAGPAAA